MEVKVLKNILGANEQLAEKNQQLLEKNGIHKRDGLTRSR